MKLYKINDDFSELEEFVVTLPERFDNIGTIIHDHRNVIKKIPSPIGLLVVKNFRGMYFFNRLAYSLFARSKASRSFIYSGILKTKGILTPPHVAWLNSYRLGLLTESYFISVYVPYQTLQKVLEDNVMNSTFKETLFRHLAHFTITLHKLGVYHRDYSLGNILVVPKNDGYTFGLVDLNRVDFKKVKYQIGLRNFATLGISPEDMNTLIGQYAIQSGQAPEEAINIFWRYQKLSFYLRKLRTKIRQYTLTPLERIVSAKCFWFLCLLQIQVSEAYSSGCEGLVRLLPEL